jgi:competence protein ComEC
MLDAAENAGLETYIADAGDKFTVGALQLSILSPRVEDIPKLESNDSSLVILATYGERSFLFTGDAENEGEELLLKYSGNNLRCDVFSAGHHGSKTSNSLELLQAARPEFVVISCGKDNKYGHPDPEALESFAAVGATVYRTDELGTVIFVTDGVELTKK